MKIRSIIYIAALVVIAAALVIAASFLNQESEESTYTFEHHEDGVTVLSETYHVDQIYKSMKGPQSTQEFPLTENGERELVWIHCNCI